MRRREFIAGLGSAAAWPIAVQAQQPDRARRVAVLFNVAENDQEGQAYLTVLQQALKTLGWTLGRDLTMEYYWTGGDFERMRSSAVKLVSTTPDVILATNGPTLEALQRENHTIPTVFMFLPDPVLGGYIASLAHPGGNLTGVTHFEYPIGGKWLGLLKEAVPRIARVGIVWNPQNISVGGFMKSIASAASLSGVQAVAIHVQNADEIESGVNAFAGEPDGGLVVLPDVTTLVRRDLVIRLAASHRLPALFPFRTFVTGGGLMCYGINTPEVYRQAALYVDRVLKGEKPADLPVQAPTKFELVINLTTAKALGIEVPPTLLSLADELID